MADSKNVFIPRSIAATNIDSLVKTGVSEIPLRNGDIVAIGQKDKGVYKLSAPTSDTTRFGIVYNADVVNENGRRGLGDDPRDIKFSAGTIVNFFIPNREDEISVTEVSGTAEGAKYIAPMTDEVGYTYSNTIPDTGLVFEITDNKFISIGNERVPTVEAVCVKA